MVVGDGLARTIGLKVGDTLEPKPGIVWKVTGILDSRGAPFDSEIWAKREEVGRLFGKDNEEKKQSFYTSVVISTPSLRTAEKVAEAIRTDTSVSVNAMTERKYYEELSKGNAAFMFAALFIAAVMGIGGMFGLMNTMFAAVSQRINDIGVLRVMGYTRGQILLSFLLESLMLALVGGGVGLALGYLVNGMEQKGMISSGAGGGKFVVFKMTVDAWVLKLCIGFALAMGLLGGLLPALSAMRLKLLDTLR
jgi:ABC-type antimicrobial peptide transport system permease subunit